MAITCSKHLDVSASVKRRQAGLTIQIFKVFELV